MQEVHPSRGDLATFHTVFLDISTEEYYQHNPHHVYALGGYLIITQKHRELHQMSKLVTLNLHIHTTITLRVHHKPMHTKHVIIDHVLNVIDFQAIL